MNLKTEINSIKIIDHHLHAMDPFYWFDALGKTPPFPPHIHGIDIPSPATHLSKTKKCVTIFKGLYDFPYETITEENKKELQELYDKSKPMEGQIYTKALELAGIEKAFTIALSRPVLAPGLDANRFKVVGYSDGFIVPLDNSELKKAGIKSQMFITLGEIYAENMKKELNWHPETFDDYLKFLSAVLEKNVQQGCVALKSSCGYWRTLEFEWVSEEEARDVFNAKDTSPLRYKRLQDYLQKFILVKLGQLGVPFHMHTGAGGVEGFLKENDPSLFDKFLWTPEVRNTKVILLHGGFPYCREAGMMCAAFGQAPRTVYLDLSIMWMDYPTPNAGYLVRQLRDWLEMGLASRLIYGSDATSPQKIMMSAMNFREDLCTALQGMIDDGLITATQAWDMAVQILRGNAEQVYNL